MLSSLSDVYKWVHFACVAPPTSVSAHEQAVHASHTVYRHADEIRAVPIIVFDPKGM